MRRIVFVALLLSAAAAAGDKKLRSGEGSNEAVEVTATALNADEMQQIFGSDFDNSYAVIEVTLTPKGGKPFEVHPDDFLLRSDQTGSHSGPLAASQIAGSETLVVHQTEPKRGGGGGFGGFGGIMMGGGGGGPPPPPNSKGEIKNSDKKDPMLDVLKRKILAEKTINEPVTGLLFFPLEKEKPKNLTLVYSTPPGKLRIRFK